MINDRLRKKIEPNLKLHMDREDWRYIDEMFSEVYYDTIGGVPRISLKPMPVGDAPSIQFSPVTGAYIDTATWELVKVRGVLL